MKLGIIIGILKQLSTNYIYMGTYDGGEYHKSQRLTQDQGDE